MVARKNSADSAPLRQNPLHVWQGLLAWVWHRIRTARGTAWDTGGKRFRSLARWSPLLLGTIAVLGGQLLANAAAIPRPSAAAALASAASLVLWLGVGLAVMWWMAGPPNGGPASVVDAWAFGLIPWIAAALPLLQLLAWIASAVVTTWGLKRVLHHKRDAVRVVGAAWGAQAVIAALLWLWAPASLLLLAG